MAWDLLRGPSNYQDAFTSSYCTQPRWHFAFHFGYGVDVLEENALNEKYCVQVLRILITKADAEIDELEKDLVSLQSELAFAEYDGWPDICCNVLKEKIDCLDISLRSLRDKDEHHIDVHFLMHREPAETIYELVKALLRKHCQGKDEQDVIKNSSLDVTGYGVDLLEEAKNLSTFDPNFTVKEEITEPIITPTENCMLLSSSLQLQEKQTNSLETVKDSSLESVKLAAGHSDEGKLSSHLGSKSARKGECENQKFPHEDNKLVRSLSLEIAANRKHNLEVVKPVDTFLKNFSTDALKHVIGNSNEKIKLSDSGSSCMTEEVEGDAAVDVIILNSMFMRNQKKTDPVSKVKPENSAINDTASAALGCGTANPSKRKKACMPNGQGDVNEKVREHQFTATDISRNLNISGKRKCKGNLHKIVKPVNSTIKDISPDDLRHTTSLDKKLNGSHSKLSVLRQAKLEKPKGEEIKLNKYHALKTAQMEESKDVQAQEIGLSISSSNTEEKKKGPLQMLKDQEAGSTDSGQSALISSFESQDHRDKDRVKPQEGGKPSVEVQMAETSANDKRPNLNLCVKQQGQKIKKKIQSNLPSVQEADSTPMEVVLDLSSISKAKRQKTVKVYNENVSLNKLLRKKPDQQENKRHTFTANGRKNQALQSKMKGRKSSNSPLNEDISDSYRHITDSQIEGDMTTSLVQPSKQEAREPGITGDVRKSSVSPKKRKISSSLPIIVEIKHSSFHIPNGYEDTTDGTKKEDILVTDSCSIDGSCANDGPKTLNDLTLVELRAIAKQQSMTRYHKLRKEVLIAQLANTLGSCQIYM